MNNYMSVGVTNINASITIVPKVDGDMERRGGFWSSAFTPSVNGELVRDSLHPKSKPLAKETKKSKR